MMSRVRDSRELAGAWARFQRHGFLPAADDLAPVVARYWWACWDLRGQPDYRQLIVPYPSVQLTFPTGAPPLVRGVYSGRIQRTLSGAGGVLGVTFRPGVFRRFLTTPVAALTDRALPATAVFGPSLPVPSPFAHRLSPHKAMQSPAAAARAPAAGPDGVAAVVRGPQVEVDGVADAVRAAVAELEGSLRRRIPPPDPVGDQVADWVERIAGTPDVHRVDQAAELFGTAARQLQRLFAEHVGVGPKWVIRRFRLHEVTERMASRTTGGTVDWAGLAADLGYADQAHLTRDFTAMFGEPPTSYAARYPT
jgi:AraC-like DNA-binding protein